eukprot:2630291-Prymnesium_polylepis.1
MQREWSTSVTPEPVARSSTSRKTCRLGQISRQRCLMSLHTSWPSGHASASMSRSEAQHQRLRCAPGVRCALLYAELTREKEMEARRVEQAGQVRKVLVRDGRQLNEFASAGVDEPGHL